MAEYPGDVRLFINGSYAEGAGEARQQVRSPVTGAVIGTVPVPGAGEIDAAVAAARAAQGVGPGERVGAREGLPRDRRRDHRPARGAGPAADPGAGQAARGVARRHRRGGHPVPPARRGRGPADRGDDLLDRLRQADVDLLQAGRHLGDHHAVELPAADVRRVRRARPGHRQRARRQAAGAHRVHGARRHGDPPGGGGAGRPGQHPARRGPDRRSCSSSTRASTRSASSAPPPPARRSRRAPGSSAR